MNSERHEVSIPKMSLQKTSENQVTRFGTFNSERRDMNNNNSTIAFCRSRTAKHSVGDDNGSVSMKTWGESDVFWSGFLGVLFGSAFFWIPSLRPLMVAGLLFGWIVKTMENAIVIDRLNAIGASLQRFGIPKNKVLRYETALKTGKFVLIAHGSIEDITHAKEILNRTGSETLEHHQ